MILVGFLSALIVAAATFQPLRADRIDAEGCGQRPLMRNRQPVSTYVVGGQEVDPKFSYPWMCRLQKILTGSYVCGCSLIKNLQGQYFVLTARHCVSSSSVQTTEALVGAHNASDATESSRQKLRFLNLHMHSKFNFKSRVNDIAIFSLVNQPVENDYVQPVCIPNTIYTAGDPSVVTGWGSTFHGGNVSEVLLEGHTFIVDDEACVNAYANFKVKIDLDSMMCAGIINVGGVDACGGDSGGPLVVKQNGEWKQVGIVSWGNKCAEPDYPGVYSNVYKMRDWINEIIND